jgi:uncharacterized membrane protein
VELSRLEAFSDGVFAIAITLLVLFFLDADVRGGRLTTELLHLWPAYVAYTISFATIGILWVNHHAMFRHIAAADRTLLFLNVLFLMPVVFIPFPTALLSEFVRSDNGTAAAVLYGITMTSLALLFNAVWRYAAWNRRLLRSDVDDKEASGISRSYLPGPFIYGGATAVAFASPEASAAVYGAIALFYVVSSSVWGAAD